MPSSSARKSHKREQLILDHMPQVRILAARLHRRCPSSVAVEDLVSAGTIGLIQATDRFDHRRNIKFQTLADHRIRGAMLDYLRDLDPLPRATRRFVRERDPAVARLERADYNGHPRLADSLRQLNELARQQVLALTLADAFLVVGAVVVGLMLVLLVLPVRTYPPRIALTRH